MSCASIVYPNSTPDAAYLYLRNLRNCIILLALVGFVHVLRVLSKNFSRGTKGFYVSFFFLEESGLFLNTMLIPSFTSHESEKFHLSLNQSVSTYFSTLPFPLKCKRVKLSLFAP
jgi:hypothetical protein